MAKPNSRATLIDYCKRTLGFPVVEINVDADQVEDRIDEAFQFFQDYHYDSMQKVYLKHRLSTDDVARQYIDITQASGVGSTSNGSTTVTGHGSNFAAEFGANVSRISIGGQDRLVTAIANATSLTVDSAFTADNTQVPITNVFANDSIIGINRIFSFGSGSSNLNMFDVRYQMRLNDMYSFTSTTMVNYTIMQSHIRMLDMLLNGEVPIRFNRHQSRLYIDMDWSNDIQPNEFLIIEAWKIVDPDAYTDVYNDRWLKKYATALIKKQWGTNMKKFGGVQLPGGVTLNGQVIFDEAVTEIAEIESAIQLMFETPAEFFVG